MSDKCPAVVATSAQKLTTTIYNQTTMMILYAIGKIGFGSQHFICHQKQKLFPTSAATGPVRCPLKAKHTQVHYVITPQHTVCSFNLHYSQQRCTSSSGIPVCSDKTSCCKIAPTTPTTMHHSAVVLDAPCCSRRRVLKAAGLRDHRGCGTR